MRRVIKNFFLVVFILLNSNVSALNILWYYTNFLNNEDVRLILEYSSQLVKRKEGTKFFLIDANSGYKIQLNLDQFESNVKITENKKFKSNQDLLIYCDSLFKGENCFMYAKIKNDIPSNIIDLPLSSKDFRSLVKKSIREKVSDLKILYFNGFKPYKSSKERYSARMANAKKSNDYSGIKIELLNEKRGNTLELHPDEKYYKFIFDSIGIFDEYELEIKCLSETAQGIWIKERVKFSEFDNQGDIVLFNTGEQRECYLKINEKLLGAKCFEFARRINTSEIPEFEDEDCEPCKMQCLYQKKFSVSISGVSFGYKDEAIKVINAPVLFQCVRE